MKNMYARVFAVCIGIGIAIISTAAVWYRAFSVPNISFPVLQSIFFTVIIFAMLWFCLGCPKVRRSKAKGLEEYLASNEFRTADLSMQYPNSNFPGISRAMMKRNDIEFSILGFESDLGAFNAFKSISKTILESTGDFIREGSMESANKHKYELETPAKLYTVICRKEKVVFVTASAESKKELQAILKSTRY